VRQDLADSLLDLAAQRRVVGGEINERYDVHDSPLDAESQQQDGRRMLHHPVMGFILV